MYAAAAVGRSPLPSGHAFPAADMDSDLGSDDDVEGVPGSKRKRPISVSCELCKQRKVKCDRGQPSCGWCTRNGAACEYKERKKPGLRAGYGRELEQRLDRLEEVLRAHSQILQTSYGPNVPAPPPRSNPSEQGTPRDIATTTFRPNEPNRTPQQADQATFAGGAGASQFSGSPTSNMAFPQQNQQNHNQGQMDQDLPPYDLLYSLVEIYFQHINTWCPILFKKTTMARLFGSNNDPSNQANDEADRILLHAIVATSMRYSTDARLTEDRRERYHRTSKQKVLLYGMENSSVTSLQALVILALDICGSANGPPGWNIMALITRSVVQLGLAVESNSFMVAPKYTSIYTLRAMVLPEPHDFAEDESRRRLFWMVYLLDRYATISTAFEFALDSKEIDRRLPCHDDFLNANARVETRWFDSSDEAAPIHITDNINNNTEQQHQQQQHQPDRAGTSSGGNLGALAYYVEILGLLSKIHRFLKQPVNISDAGDVERWQSRYKELDAMLESWHYALPPEYGKLAQLLASAHAKDKAILVMLHATFNTAVIRLHSSAAYPTTRSAIFTPSYRASQRCLSAVENIATIGDFVRKHALLAQLGPTFAFTLWVAARLLLVHGSTVERKLSTQIGFFVDSLRELGKYWPVAARYCGVLQRVLDEHRESEQTGDGVTPSSVAILADMRRTAFDLEFLISRQPRHGAAAASAMMMMMMQQQPIKTAVATPARTPGPNELEYLDVFDFFNVPRLPVGGDLAPQGMDGMQGGGMDQQQQQVMANEFNITNFMMDANSDWLFKQEGGKFMTA